MRGRTIMARQPDFSLFTLDAHGMVTSWNDYAKALKGYQASEIIGRHFSIFYPKDRIASGFPQAELAWAAKMGYYAHEGWRVRKDGSQFWAHVVIMAQRDAHGVLTGFIKYTRDMTRLRAKLHGLESKDQLGPES